MNKKASQFVAILLMAVLAFSQIGLNFFHTKHLEHGPVVANYDKIPQGDAVQKHDEHCKVCSLDFHGKLYEKPNSFPSCTFTTPITNFVFLSERVLVFSSNILSRGPPTV